VHRKDVSAPNAGPLNGRGGSTVAKADDGGANQGGRPLLEVRADRATDDAQRNADGAAVRRVQDARLQMTRSPQARTRACTREPPARLQMTRSPQARTRVHSRTATAASSRLRSDENTVNRDTRSNVPLVSLPQDAAGRRWSATATALSAGAPVSASWSGRRHAARERRRGVEHEPLSPTSGGSAYGFGEMGACRARPPSP